MRGRKRSRTVVGSRSFSGKPNSAWEKQKAPQNPELLHLSKPLRTAPATENTTHPNPRSQHYLEGLSDVLIATTRSEVGPSDVRLLRAVRVARREERALHAHRAQPAGLLRWDSNTVIVE